MEIQSILLKRPEVKDVYGFGSFFRGEPFNDIDILFVLPCEDRSILISVREIRALLHDASRRLRITLHPLILTDREIGEAPLRDMHELVPFHRWSRQL